MNRLKLLAAATLLAVPVINACGEDVPPPKIGSILGQVAIEQEPQAGVTVTLGSEQFATTTSAGAFSFDKVEEGTHTLTISNFTPNGSFSQTTANATIKDDGEKVTVNFNGEWIRTSSVAGKATVEGLPLGGLDVNLTGMSDAQTTTDLNGGYSFTGLRAGEYTVTVSGHDPEDVEFSATSSQIQLAVGESGAIDFPAIYLRVSDIVGQVSVDGAGLEGVTVGLTGVGENRAFETNNAGMYTFEGLRKGEYSIAISGFDTDEYEFDPTSQTVDVAFRATENVPFEGTALRTATVTGTVTIEGQALEGVTVSLVGQGEDLSVVTNAAGQWSFGRLHAGSYSVAISGFDSDEYEFKMTSQTVAVERKETATVGFDGIKLRTAGVSGQVTIGGAALGDVAITVRGTSGKGNGEEHVALTDDMGRYSIDRLHAGDYMVSITNPDDDEYGFEMTSQTVTVSLNATATASFDGYMLRTAEVTGTVTISGDPLGDVTVTVRGTSGKGDDEEHIAVTDAAGKYSVDRLHAGDYTVSIANPDDDEYGFDVTSRDVEVELEETAMANFDGIMLRTAEVTGAVTIAGEALAGVAVTLTGTSGKGDGEEYTRTTGAGGGYSVDRLHAGDYTVSIANPDDDEYGFDVTSRDVEVALEGTAMADFDGYMLRTAEVNGAVTIAGDPLAGVAVTLTGTSGKGDGEEYTRTTGAGGEYSVDRLHAGDYTVSIANPDDDEYGFDVTSRDVEVALEGTAMADFDGYMLRTAEVNGAVTIAGDPLGSVTVTLVGTGTGKGAGEKHTAVTDAMGEYSIGSLYAGGYTVSIANPDDDEYGFDVTSRDVEVALEGTAMADFDGYMLRTAEVNGAVTIAGEALAGVAVTLMGTSGKGDGEEHTRTTDAMGGYSIGSLHAGGYTVSIANPDDDEYGFDVTSRDVEVALEGTAMADFDGYMLRTAEVNGAVTVGDVDIGGVTVTLMGTGTGKGAGEERTAVTDAMGEYSIGGLHAGGYSVTISDFDDDEYGFETSQTVMVERDGTATADFDGIMLRTAEVNGTVTIEGAGALAGVTVTVTGTSGKDLGNAYDDVTDAMGGYSIGSLHAGGYSVVVSDFDADLYEFTVTSQSASVALEGTATVDFKGVELRTSEVTGAVTIAGVGLEGVTVGLTGMDEDLSMTTNAVGQWSFPDLHAGGYTVEISGFDADEYAFDMISQDVNVGRKETKTIAFDGYMLRTAEVTGAVTIAGEPLAGVEVALVGTSGRAEGEEDDAVTNTKGEYSIDRLHAGDYTVTITNPDADEYGFETMERTVTVALDGTGRADFDGYKRKTAGIEGTVTAGDEPIAVTVTISGGEEDQTREIGTNASGGYEFDGLYAGDYTVTISGYDEAEFKFDPESKPATVALNEVDTVDFEGTPLQTASISGRVTTDGEPTEGLTIALAGPETDTAVSNANGQYNFPGLPAGDYTLSIGGYDAEEFEYADASREISLKLDQGAIENFVGRSLRTVVIKGSVMAETDSVASTAQLYITIPGGIKELDSQSSDDGTFEFDSLLDGTYVVVITGYDDEYEFAKIPLVGQWFVAQVIPAATDDTATVAFMGGINRTASIGGTVTVDDVGLADVTVVVSGGGDMVTDTLTTDSAGAYMLDGLRKGDYTVSITNPDDDMYDFPTMSRSENLTPGQAHDDVSFAGSTRRGASISGQVQVEGDGLLGVTVMLSGDKEDTTTTDGNGEYNFPGLAGGDYVVTIENPDTSRYTFEVNTDSVELPSDSKEIVDFTGKYVAASTVMGTYYLDEMEKDSAWGDDEPAFTGKDAKLVKLMLTYKVEDGEDSVDVVVPMTSFDDSSGVYKFSGLKPRTYALKYDKSGNAKLAAAGYAYAGDTAATTVEVGGSSEHAVDLPFAITKQTITIGAVLANKKDTSDVAVAGVKFDVYPNLREAQKTKGTKLGSGATLSTGTAAITFDRAKDWGVNGKNDPSDYLVFIKATSDSTSYDQVKVSNDTKFLEVKYDRTRRTWSAPRTIHATNMQAHFQWQVKSVAKTVRGDTVGGRGLNGWKATVGKIDGEPTETKTIDKVKTPGLAWFEDSVAYSDIPKKYTIKVDTAQHDSVDGGELWKLPASISYTHDGLHLPGTTKKPVVEDAGTFTIQWTTQSLFLGFHREMDRDSRFTKDRIGQGETVDDHLPVGSHLRSGSDKVVWDFQAPQGPADRHDTYKWDHDDNSKTADRDANEMADWKKASWLKDGGSYGHVVRFKRIPTNIEELQITLNVGDDRKILFGPDTIYNADNVNLAKIDNDDGVYNTFGDDGGGHWGVWLCGQSNVAIDPEASLALAYDNCSTYGYQWTNNSVEVGFNPRERTYSDSRFTHSTTAKLEFTDSMRVSLKMYDWKGSRISGYDTTARTAKKIDWSRVNDGIYVLEIDSTSKKKFYSVDAGQKRVDTLQVFYNEYDRKVFDSSRTYKVTLAKTKWELHKDVALKKMSVTAKGGSTVTRKLSGGLTSTSREVELEKGDTLFTVTVAQKDHYARFGDGGLAAVGGLSGTDKGTKKGGGKASGAFKDDVTFTWLAPKPGNVADYVITSTAEDGETKKAYTIKVRHKGIRFAFSSTVGKDGVVQELDTIELAEDKTITGFVSVATKPKTDTAVTIIWTFTDAGSRILIGDEVGNQDRLADTATLNEDNWEDGVGFKVKISSDLDGDNATFPLTVLATTAPSSRATFTADTLDFLDSLTVEEVDKDKKMFLSPTKVTVVGSGASDVNGAKNWLNIRPQTSTEVPSIVTLLWRIVPESAASSTSSTTIPVNDTLAGADLVVYGDTLPYGEDFKIEVGVSGGLYNDIDLPDISVDWIDDTVPMVAMSYQEVNTVPGRWIGGPVGSPWSYIGLVADTVQRANEADDTLYLLRDTIVITIDDCPSTFDCYLGTSQTDTIRLHRDVNNVTNTALVHDSAAAGTYNIEYKLVEYDHFDDDSVNGFFINGIPGASSKGMDTLIIGNDTTIRRTLTKYLSTKVIVLEREKK